ncbi:MAG: hypothetical protein ACREQ4_03540 [Candidatus Binataceae bacterium]
MQALRELWHVQVYGIPRYQQMMAVRFALLGMGIAGGKADPRCLGVYLMAARN